MEKVKSTVTYKFWYWTLFFFSNSSLFSIGYADADIEDPCKFYLQLLYFVD